ncbi:MAG: hypothetical protein LUC83_00405 [Clostridiales bacterium]|nr:hypothetical protein [Clostridiales bacterium]
MARGKKIISVEERIAAAEEKITAIQEELKAKKAELKALQEEKEAADQKKIIDAVKASGKTMEEVLAFLNAKEGAGE